MTTNFGKFCRKLRIDNDELLYDMAAKLGVSSAFLSKVENGKKKPPAEWQKILEEKYDLDDRQSKDLEQYIYEAQNYNSIDISYMNDSNRMMMLSFARKFDRIDKKKLQTLLNEEEDAE